MSARAQAVAAPARRFGSAHEHGASTARRERGAVNVAERASVSSRDAAWATRAIYKTRTASIQKAPRTAEREDARTRIGPGRTRGVPAVDIRPDRPSTGTSAWPSGRLVVARDLGLEDDAKTGRVAAPADLEGEIVVRLIRRRQRRGGLRLASASLAASLLLGHRRVLLLLSRDLAAVRDCSLRTGPRRGRTDW